MTSYVLTPFSTNNMVLRGNVTRCQGSVSIRTRDTVILIITIDKSSKTLIFHTEYFSLRLCVIKEKSERI